MLDPDAGHAPPRLFFADTLEASIDTNRMGIRGSMQRYGWEQVRSPDGLMNSRVPNKNNQADHAVDTVRYGVVAFRFDPKLHGGAELPYAMPPEEAPLTRAAA
jgi:hypothetical protein